MGTIYLKDKQTRDLIEVVESIEENSNESVSELAEEINEKLTSSQKLCAGLLGSFVRGKRTKNKFDLSNWPKKEDKE